MNIYAEIEDAKGYIEDIKCHFNVDAVKSESSVATGAAAVGVAALAVFALIKRRRRTVATIESLEMPEGSFERMADSTGVVV